jgi:hypothetical protein
LTSAPQDASFSAKNFVFNLQLNPLYNNYRANQASANHGA